MGQKYAAYNASGQITGFYDSVDSPVPSGVDAIKITEAQWQECLSAQGWTVVNDTLTAPPALTAAEILAQAQSAQIALVTQGYNAATDYVPVTIDGTTYQVDNTAAKQPLNLSLAITANTAVQSSAWAADTEYTGGQTRSVSGVILFCSTPGKSGTSAPTPPTAFGTPVTDGTAAWELMGRKVYLQGGSFVLLTPQQILSAFQQGELYLHQMSDKLVSLMEQIDAATTVAEVQAIVW